jgi:hypothetical protein
MPLPTAALATALCPCPCASRTALGSTKGLGFRLLLVDRTAVGMLARILPCLPMAVAPVVRCRIPARTGLTVGAMEDSGDVEARRLWAAAVPSLGFLLDLPSLVVVAVLR